MPSAPNAITRIIQLVLDKAAAAKAEAEAKKALGGVEQSASGIERIFKRIGAAILAALSVRAIVNFARSAIREATEAEQAWTDLAGAVNATGAEFRAVEKDLRSLAGAFQEATVHTDEDYAKSLSRLVSITDDLDASIQNMGLVANVAARFFNGELAPATDLVAKVMNGATGQLARMGIQAKTAQEGLDILAQRSMGAAEARAATFGGRVQQLNNLWGEFKEQIGGAIIETDGAATGLDVVRGVLIQLTQAVEDNKEAIGRDFVTAVKAAVYVVDAIYRGIRALGELLVGPFFVGLGAISFAWGKLTQVTVLAASAVSGFLDLIGLDGASKRMAAFTQELDAQAKAFTEWGKAAMDTGVGTIGDAFTRLATPTFDFDNLPTAGSRRGLNAGAPRAGKNQKGDGTGAGKKELSDQAKALDEYSKAMRTNQAMAEILGEKYDALGGEAQALTTLLQKLSAIGFQASDPFMAQYAARLREVSLAAEQSTALREYEQRLANIGALAPLLGKDFDELGQRAQALEELLGKLAAADPQDSRLADLAGQLEAINRELRKVNAVEDFEQSMRAAADAAGLLGEQFDNAGQRLDPAEERLRALTEEAGNLTRVIMDLTQAGFDSSDPVLAAYIQRLYDVQGAIKETAEGMELMSGAAELMGQVVGAALTTGLAPFAAGKARQNAIEAAEQTVRGIVASLSPFTAPLAAAHFAAAAKHAAIAAAWAALAKGFGGAGGSGAGGGSGGGGVGAARGASGAASRAAEPKQEVHIHLVGPGFDALNVDVQRVTYGAIRNARERFGENADIRLVNDR